MEFVNCVCVWLGAGWEDMVWTLPMFEEQGGSGICVLVTVLWVVLDTELVVGLGQGLDSLC